MTTWYRFSWRGTVHDRAFVVARVPAQDVVKVSQETHKVLLDNEHET